MLRLTLVAGLIFASTFAMAEPFGPSGLTATVSKGPVVTLQWIDNSHDEDLYFVERRNSNTGAYALKASMSKNLIRYVDNTVPATGPVWYRVRAKNKVGYSTYSNEVLAGTDLGVVKKVAMKWDIVDNLATAVIADPQSVLGAYEGNGLFVTLNMGTTYQTMVSTTVRASAFTYLGYSLNFPVSSDQFNTLFNSAIDGFVPYSIRYDVGPVVGPRTPVLSESGMLKLKRRGDNYEYQIGVLQVIPPAIDLSRLNICLMQDASLGGQGYFPIGNVVPDCVKAWDWGSNAPTITTRSYPVMDLLMGSAGSTWLSDVTSAGNQKQGLSGDIAVYSLRYLARYWEELLSKQGIQTSARLGRNPRFRLNFIPMVVAPNTLNSNDHGAVKEYFDRLIVERGIDVAGYEFMVHVLIVPGNYSGKDFNRSFAAGKKSYNSLQLSSDNVVFNRLFLTVAHEMGHQLFNLPDRYDGYGLRLPDGVPDPKNFPQREACVMAKSFGWQPISTTMANTYSTAYYTNALVPYGFARFHTEDPLNQRLCPEDAKIIQGY